VSAQEIAAAAAACDRAALDGARARARAYRAYHRRQVPRDERFTDALGVELGYRWTRSRRRALRAGRHRGLSVLGADERVPPRSLAWSGW